MLPGPQQLATPLISMIDNIMVAYRSFTERVAATASSFSPQTSTTLARSTISDIMKCQASFFL